MYWNQKKVIAKGIEPTEVKRIMDSMMTYTAGMSLTGAGGGGFLYVLTKDPSCIQNIKDILDSQFKHTGLSFHDIESV